MRFEQQYQNAGFQAQRMYPVEALIRFLAVHQDLFAASRAVRTLDLGCGSGGNLWMLEREGLGPIGLDGSPSGLAAAKVHLSSKWGLQAPLVSGDFTALPFPDESFDLVVDVVSLQHLPLAPCGAALREIARVLHPGGRFFSLRLSDCSTMYRFGGGTLIDKVTIDDIRNVGMPLRGNGPTSFWNPACARREYHSAGLVIDAIDVFARHYHESDPDPAAVYVSIDAIRPKMISADDHVRFGAS